jgi:hypothetical protein
MLKFVCAEISLKDKLSNFAQIIHMCLASKPSLMHLGLQKFFGGMEKLCTRWQVCCSL